MYIHTVLVKHQLCIKWKCNHDCLLLGDDCCDDRAALMILCLLLQKKTSPESVIHAFENYDVSHMCITNVYNNNDIHHTLR